MQSGLELISFSSEKVHAIAFQVYEELKRFIVVHGDCSIDKLTHLFVNLLDLLDETISLKVSADAQLQASECEKNDLLLTLEKETNSRRIMEQRANFLDDIHTQDVSTLQSKLQDQCSTVKILDCKYRNAEDLISRYEKREADLRGELKHACQRYTTLLGLHIASLQRGRQCQIGGPFEGSDRAMIRLNQLSHQTVFGGCQPHLSDQANMSPLYRSANDILEPIEVHSSLESDYIDVSYKCVSECPKDENSSVLESGLRNSVKDTIDLMNFFDESIDFEKHLRSPMLDDESTINNDFSAKALSENSELSACESLETEVQKLIAENYDLIEAKNALNTLKDDLLTRLDNQIGANITMKSRYERMASNLCECKNQLSQMMRLTDRNARENACLRRQLLRIGCLPVTLRSTGSLPQIASFDEGLARGTLDSLGSTSVESALVPFKAPEDTQLEIKSSCVPISYPMIRAILERNFYKKKCLELQEALLYDDHSLRELGGSTKVPFGRNIISYAFDFFQFIQNVAVDVVSGFTDMVSDSIQSTITKAPPPSQREQTRHSSMYEDLWKIFGSFIGQAVTSVVDTVIGTGGDVSRDACRVAITSSVENIFRTNHQSPIIFRTNHLPHQSPILFRTNHQSSSAPITCRVVCLNSASLHHTELRTLSTDYTGLRVISTHSSIHHHAETRMPSTYTTSSGEITLC